jgi:hypothetical protein
VLLVLTIFGLAVLYRYGPSREPAEWRWLTPGAVAATVIWILGSIAFSIYVSNFGDYTATYGALGGVILLLTWFWLSAFVVLLGAELNAEIEHQTGARHHDRRRPPARASAARAKNEAGSDAPQARSSGRAAPPPGQHPSPDTRSASRVSSSKAWLIPPIDGTNSIAAGISRATFIASCSAPEGMSRQRPGASASAASASRATRSGSIRVGTRFQTARTSALSFRARRDLGHRLAHRFLHVGKPRLVRVAPLDAEARPAGHDGGRVRMHLDPADRPDGVGRDHRRKPLVQPQRDGGHPLHRVLPQRIGVVPAWFWRPVSVTSTCRAPTMAVTMPTACPAPSSTGPCSICASTKAVKRAGSTGGPISGATAARASAMVMPPASRRRSASSCVTSPVQISLPPRPPKRPSSSWNDTTEIAGPPAARAARATLQRRDGPEGPVEPAALGLAVGVRPHEKRPPRRQPEEVAARVPARLEPRLGHAPRKPAARGDVGVREGGAHHALADPRRAMRAQGVQIGQEPRGIDRDHASSSLVRRHG